MITWLEKSCLIISFVDKELIFNDDVLAVLNSLFFFFVISIWLQWKSVKKKERIWLYNKFLELWVCTEGDLVVEMNVSHASVHPAEYPPTTDGGEGGGGGGGGNIEVPRVRMKDFQGMPGTQGGLALRICQFVFAAVGLCIMATTSDFPSVTAFW